jgi:thiamine biosynthesis lipoprotein
VTETAPTVSFPALGTTATLAVRATEQLPRARRLLEHELEAVDLACSRFRTDSELTRLNGSAGKRVPVSAFFLEALERAIEAAAATGGAVDPTVGRALRLSGYDETFARVRLRDGRYFTPSSAVARAWQRIEIDRARGTVRVPAGVELDLGATAKAFAADRAAARAADAVGSGVLVSLGGDVAVAGEAPPEGWSIGLADDHAALPDDRTPVVAIRTGGLASSSTTVRRWPTAAGDRHHIVDPRTGTSAATPWRTVSVAAASCLDANTASTAALVLGESAVPWLCDLGLPTRLVRSDGSVSTLAGWPAEAA